MNNTNISPLYILVSNRLKYRRKKRLGTRTIELVTNAINNAIDDCCVLDFPPTQDPFVVAVYTLLTQMDLKEHMPKLKVVRDLLAQYAACCVVELPPVEPVE